MFGCHRKWKIQNVRACNRIGAVTVSNRRVSGVDAIFPWFLFINKFDVISFPWTSEAFQWNTLAFSFAWWIFGSYFDIESNTRTVFSRFGRLSNFVIKPPRCEFKVFYDRGIFISSNTLNAFHGLCQNVLSTGNNSSSGKSSVDLYLSSFPMKLEQDIGFFLIILSSKHAEKRMQNNKMKM